MEGTWQLHLKGEFQLSLFVTKSACRHTTALLHCIHRVSRFQCFLWPWCHMRAWLATATPVQREGERGAGTTVVCPPHMAPLHTDAGCHYCEGKGKQFTSRTSEPSNQERPLVECKSELESVAGFVSRLWSSPHSIRTTHLNHSQGDPYVHNSHDSTAAANCSYDHKIGGGGGGGGWEYGPIPTPHSDFERRNWTAAETAQTELK